MNQTNHAGISEQAKASKAAFYQLQKLKSHQRDSLLLQMHEELSRSKEKILKENQKDVQRAEQKGISCALLDRLKLDEKRFSQMLVGLRDIANEDHFLSEAIESRELSNGLKLSKVRVPIGLIGIVYESRPNVTCEAAALCLKSANAVILKGGSEALNTNRAICEAMQIPLARMGLQDALAFIDSTDRASVKELVELTHSLDLVIPRGGQKLIENIIEWARVPVIKHSKGVCHIFVDESADPKSSSEICINAKCQRPGVCNAMESLLIHEKIAERLLATLVPQLLERKVELRGDEKSRRLFGKMKAASEEDWSTEYLDNILSIKIVKDVDEAISHINKYGSGHSDAILTNSQISKEKFLQEIDSAVVYVNASTRFTDGAEFGMGAEIGISTDKLHARGPMGAKELTTYKWQAIGNGQIRS